MSGRCDRRCERLGWHYDEDTGTLMRDVIHRMGRRCRNWDYCGRGTYLITLTLADRASRALGRLRHDAQKGAFVELSAVGRLVEATMAELPHQWPDVEVLGLQVMPDHLHAVIAVRARQRKPQGAIVGSFKSKATSQWLKLGRTRPSATGAESNFATGDEPLRAVAAEPGFMTAIKALGDNGRSRGAAARAPSSLFAAGHRVITLANKGFSPLYKPGGKLFDTCAAGNLLMLSPVSWPYLPGEKKMTRADACVLNRLAQWIAGPGAVEIIYKGIQRTDIDQLARNAVGAERRQTPKDWKP